MDARERVLRLIEEAKKDTGTWKDDGCGFTGTAHEVDQHILEGAKGKEFGEIKCWGRTEVGKPPDGRTILGIKFGGTNGNVAQGT